ncbi:hypothetical protein SY83_18150 [Paenibacillus swuensis]|uniref:GH18 domain-containing protein n=2 Tax=Paenibacillus swuensis TaxID=1178515 RepID=A0A172TQB2_9BACL|nr:hypothetical protein SY83_18150 [Paenibacillus swuensis]
MTLFAQPFAFAATQDSTTKYRVYQKQNVLKEFADLKQAKTYASSFRYSRVENIGSRGWVWHNLPNYKVYQQGISKPELEFIGLSEAIAAAKKLPDSAVRQLDKPGWVWSNYTQYKLYQGEKTLPQWGFNDLATAKKAAAGYVNMHIIDEKTNTWVWDNITPELEKKLRTYGQNYEVTIGDTPGTDKFYLLEEAVKKASTQPDAIVMNVVRGQTVYSSLPAYEVYQGEFVKRFKDLKQALYFAKSITGSKIMKNGNTIWTTEHYYHIMQDGKSKLTRPTATDAITYAKWYSNSTVVTADGITLWDNYRKLVYMGWNGTNDPDRITEHVANTQGLDVDSPSWFALMDGTGALEDKSSEETVVQLKQQGIAVHPLVHNQFNAELTTSFLANAEAQKTFTRTVVDKIASIGGTGVNLDFEAMKASDRDRYTKFVTDFVYYAHTRKLKVSIDLPRGSLAWNAKTAYDHAALAAQVDQVIIMAYDQYWKGSTEAGSVSGLQWMEEGIKEFLSYGMEREKLMLGIPFYVRQWQIDGTGKLLTSKAIFMSDLPALIQEKNAVSTWDPEFKQYKVEYSENGSRYIFWMEDHTTVKARIQLAKTYDLGGIAVWRLGYEPSALWSEILRMK